MLKLISSNRSIFIILGLYCIVYGYNLSGMPGILWDEAFYSDTAFEFSKYFHFTNKLGGFSGQQFFLYPFLLGLFYKAFSVSIFIGRIVSFLLGLTSTILFYKIIKKSIAHHYWPFITTVGFIFLNTNIILFRIIRPETLVTFLFLVLIYFFLYIQNKNRFLHWVILGTIISLITATHLIGLYASIGILLYSSIVSIQARSIRPLVGIILGGIPLGALFIFNLIMQYGSLTQFFLEMGRSGKISSGIDFNLIWTNLSQLLFASYSMGYKRLILVLIELATIILGLFSPNKKIKWLSLSMIIYLILGFSTINLFLRPYFCILPITTLIILIMRLNKKPSFYIKSLILSYLGYHLLGSSYFFYLQCHSQPLPTTEIRKQLNRSKFPIIGTNEMWFIDPNRKWIINIVPSHDKLLSSYGGYYMITSEYRLDNKSTTSGSKVIFSHDGFHRLHQTIVNRGQLYGHRVYHKHIPPYGMVSVFEMK